MWKKYNINVILFVCILAGCKNVKNDADTLYYGGPILTMEDTIPQVEALAVKDG